MTRRYEDPFRSRRPRRARPEEPDWLPENWNKFAPPGRDPRGDAVDSDAEPGDFGPEEDAPPEQAPAWAALRRLQGSAHAVLAILSTSRSADARKLGAVSGLALDRAMQHAPRERARRDQTRWDFAVCMHAWTKLVQLGAEIGTERWTSLPGYPVLGAARADLVADLQKAQPAVEEYVSAMKRLKAMERLGLGRR
jgi:hypothetical protein